MNKGLEALKNVGRTFISINSGIALDECDKYKIIENELKEYEKMKAIKGATTLDSALEQTLINSCPNVAKKLKTLEIIKRTRLNVGKFMILCKGDHEYTPNTTYEQYVYFCEHEDDIGGDKMHSFPCYRLTKEEYELVLEVIYGKETS